MDVGVHSSWRGRCPVRIKACCCHDDRCLMEADYVCYRHIDFFLGWGEGLAGWAMVGNEVEHPFMAS